MNKEKSLLQERIFGLYLRLNGYFQSGFIPHSDKWGNAGTDIDRLGLRMPFHSQREREVECDEKLNIEMESVDFIICEVKNNETKFNKSLTVEGDSKSNWTQIACWSGLFLDDQIEEIVNNGPSLVSGTVDSPKKLELISDRFGSVIIRPVLASFETNESKNEKFTVISGIDIIKFIWRCFAPDIRRVHCSTTYPYILWGSEYTDIVEYFKGRVKNNQGLGTLDDLYNSLL